MIIRDETEASESKRDQN